MKYERPKPIDKKTAIKLLQSSDIHVVCKTLIDAVAYIDDQEWLQDECLKFSKSNEYWISKTAINCLSDIARIFKKIDVDKVKKVFSELRKERPKLTDLITEAEDDFKVFLKDY